VPSGRHPGGVARPACHRRRCQGVRRPGRHCQERIRPAQADRGGDRPQRLSLGGGGRGTASAASAGAAGHGAAASPITIGWCTRRRAAGSASSRGSGHALRAARISCRRVAFHLPQRRGGGACVGRGVPAAAVASAGGRRGQRRSDRAGCAAGRGRTLQRRRVADRRPRDGGLGPSRVACPPRGTAVTQQQPVPAAPIMSPAVIRTGSTAGHGKSVR